MPSPVFISREGGQETPASTNKNAKMYDRNVFETTDREDEYGIGGYAIDDPKVLSNVAPCCGQTTTVNGEAATVVGQDSKASGATNTSTPMESRWTIRRSELYSIQAVRSNDCFEDRDRGPLYKGQIFKDKKPLKYDVGMYALTERFEWKVKRSTKTRFVTTCKNNNCEWVIRADKLKNGTHWHVKSFVKEHTCINDDNYNMQFSRDAPIRPKDIFTEVREQHNINLKYNRAYRSKNHTLNTAFGDPWESFKRLPEFFYMLEQSNPETVTKIETNSENRFAYGFMSLGASIAGFNEVIRPVIAIDATHLKAKTRGVLLVTACKDGNEMIYPLAFGFANSECTESWTWFLSQLRNVIVDPKRVMIILDRHTSIIGGMVEISPDATHGFCAYHLAQNLRKMCKQRDDVIKLYYRATYTYCIEEFEREMAELKDTHRKCYNNLLEIGIEKISRVRSPKRRYKMMTTNISESMNSCLLAIRKLPIASITEFISDLLQRWFHDRRTNAREMSTYLTRFKVDDKWTDTIVDLEQRFCSCRQWDLDELPCIHVMVVARLKGMPMTALCSDFYTTGWLKHAYSMIMNPVPKPETWNIPDEIHHRIILPWEKKRLIGRPKKSRIPSAGEFRK
ncbi:hypothetical protein Ddye_028431 [Dipteronia dyeriana]|uniref:SWIM-type domain-containing protein n=1 Tax=Dipteronia dyeriana TaxID=168575 RepID=A0AAD9WRE0_9ROSI|nr:hypothetical protein Ddye_028431 [Dipteronia dyeriana]